MPTLKDAKVTKVHMNSQDSTTGEVTSTDIDANNTSVESQTGDTEQDPDGGIIFVEETLDVTIVFEDWDALFTNTMNSGNTVETAMVNGSKIWVQIETQGGTIQDSSANNRLEVRPVVREVGDVTDKSANRKGELSFVHVDHGGVHKLS